MTLLDECILLLSQMKGVLIVISDTQNAQSPTKEKKTYTVEEIAEQLDISKKVAYSLVKAVNSVMFVLVKPYGYQRFLSING